MKVALVDLTEKTSKISEIPKEWEASYIGGKGIASKLLFKIPSKTDPLSKDNAIIFGIGPLNGVRLSGASKMTAVFKSPLTFGYGESQCGGYAPYEMAKTGIHFLYITGVSENPVYLVLEDEDIMIRDAAHLWGMDCYETEETLRKDEGGEVLSIGPAGERLVRFACITHRRGRQFGRAGAGAVMGSKRLKAIVIKGSNEIEVADPEGLKKFRSWLTKNIVVPKLESFRKFGTAPVLDLLNEAGALPTKYWQECNFDGVEKISEYMEKYKVKSTACYGCAVACGKIRGAGDLEVDGPEFETLYAFGPLCGVSDAKAIMIANDICDRYGVDTMSCGNVVAFYMKCSELGDVEQKVEFGDVEAMLDLIKKVAFREGVGDILAEGVRIAAEKLGVSVEPIHVKGLEPAGYDPRSIYGSALSYVTSQRGACHLRALAHRPNLAGIVDRTSPQGQAEIVKDLEDLYCVVDSLVFCRFLFIPGMGMSWEEVVELYKIVTGRNIGIAEIKKAGERIWDLTYKFNLREGVRDDKLPRTFFEKPVRHMGKEYVIKVKDFERMINDYWKLRGVQQH